MATLPAIVVAVVAAGAVSLLFQVVVLRALRRAAPIVRVIATIGLLGLLQAVVAKRYGVANQPIDSYLPHDVWKWGGITVQEERLYLVAITLVVTFGALGVDPVHPRRAGHQRQRPERTGGADARVVARPPRRAHLDASAGCSAGSPPCSPRRSPGCRPTTFTIVVTVAGLGAALLGGFQSFPLTLVGGLIIGVGEAMATLYGGDITDFFHQDQITGLSRMPAFLVIFLVVVVRGRGLPLRSHVAVRLPRLGTGEINVRARRSSRPPSPSSCSSA